MKRAICTLLAVTLLASQLVWPGPASAHPSWLRQQQDVKAGLEEALTPPADSGPQSARPTSGPALEAVLNASGYTESAQGTLRQIRQTLDAMNVPQQALVSQWPPGVAAAKRVLEFLGAKSPPSFVNDALGLLRTHLEVIATARAIRDSGIYLVTDPPEHDEAVLSKLVRSIEAILDHLRELDPEAYQQTVAHTRFIVLVPTLEDYGASNAVGMTVLPRRLPMAVPPRSGRHEYARTVAHEADHHAWQAQPDRYGRERLVRRPRFRFSKAQASALTPSRDPYDYLREVSATLVETEMTLKYITTRLRQGGGTWRWWTQRHWTQRHEEDLRDIGETLAFLESSRGRSALTPAGQQLVQEFRERATALRDRARPAAAAVPTAASLALSPRAQALDRRLRETADQLGWLQTWLRDRGLTLDHPSVRWAVHLGAAVTGSSSLPGLTYLYNEIPPVRDALARAGIHGLIAIPRDTSEAELPEVLAQIRAHPRVALVTVTQPHKVAVAQAIQGWGIHQWDPRVGAMGTTNNILLKRGADGAVTEAALTNSDGPAFVEQYQKLLADETFQGKQVVILGGWGGVGRALTSSIAREHPRALILSERNEQVDSAQREVARVLGERAPVTVVPADDPEDARRDHPALRGHLLEADVIINATGVGMDDDQSPIRDPSVFGRPPDRRVVVIDTIYRTKAGEPRPITPLLRQAWEAGVREVFNGWGLFVQTFSWEAAWMVEQLTDQPLDDSTREAISRQVAQWARVTRGLQEAREALAGLEEAPAAPARAARLLEELRALQLQFQA